MRPWFFEVHTVSKTLQNKQATPARAKTLWDKASDLIGADKSRSLPADVSARYKRLLYAKLSAKPSR